MLPVPDMMLWEHLRARQIRILVLQQHVAKDQTDRINPLRWNVPVNCWRGVSQEPTGGEPQNSIQLPCGPPANGPEDVIIQDEVFGPAEEPPPPTIFSKVFWCTLSLYRKENAVPHVYCSGAVYVWVCINITWWRNLCLVSYTCGETVSEYDTSGGGGRWRGGSYVLPQTIQPDGYCPQ